MSLLDLLNESEGRKKTSAKEPAKYVPVPGQPSLLDLVPVEAPQEPAAAPGKPAPSPSSPAPRSRIQPTDNPSIEIPGLPQRLQQEIRKPSSVESLRMPGRFLEEFGYGMKETALPFGVGSKLPRSPWAGPLIPKEVIEWDDQRAASLHPNEQFLRETRKIGRIAGELAKTGAIYASMQGAGITKGLIEKYGAVAGHTLLDALAGVAHGITGEIPDEEFPQAVLGMATRGGQQAALFASLGLAGRVLAPEVKASFIAAAREREAIALKDLRTQLQKIGLGRKVGQDVLDNAGYRVLDDAGRRADLRIALRLGKIAARRRAAEDAAYAQMAEEFEKYGPKTDPKALPAPTPESEGQRQMFRYGGVKVIEPTGSAPAQDIPGPAAEAAAPRTEAAVRNELNLLKDKLGRARSPKVKAKLQKAIAAREREVSKMAVKGAKAPGIRSVSIKASARDIPEVDASPRKAAVSKTASAPEPKPASVETPQPRGHMDAQAQKLHDALHKLAGNAQLLMGRIYDLKKNSPENPAIGILEAELKAIDEQMEAVRQQFEAAHLSKVEPLAQVKAKHRAEAEANRAARRLGKQKGFLGIAFGPGEKIPKPKMSVRAADREVEQVLRASTADVTILDRLASAANTTLEDLSRIFRDDWLVHNYPDLVNQLRLLKDAPNKATQEAIEGLVNIVDGLDSKGYDTFRRIVVLEDLLETSQHGVTIANNLSAAQVAEERNRLLAMASDNVKASLRRHREYIMSMGQDLVQRGKLDASSLYHNYYPHHVLDFITDRMDSSGIVPSRLKTPNRFYTKKRAGSVKLIDTDYLEVMKNYITKFNLDNRIDDFAHEQAAKYDVTGKLTPEQRDLTFGYTTREGERKLAAPKTDRTYTIDGKRYRAFQVNPGNTIYPTTTVKETVANEVIAGDVPPEALEDALGSAIALGKKNRIYLLPEEIAERFTSLRQRGGRHPFEGAFRHGLATWKRLTLDFAGVPFQVNNMVGDMINLYREDAYALLKTPEAALTLITQGRGNPAAQRVLELAEAQSVIGGQSALTRTWGDPILAEPRIAHLRSQLAVLGHQLNPLSWVEALSSGREDMTRLAKFMADVERIDKGQAPLSKVVDVTGLSRLDAAGKIARNFTVDYGAVSQDFALYRDLMFPFLTFHVRNFQNWAKYAINHPAEAAVKFGIPLTGLYMWNTGSPDRRRIEGGLPSWLRFRPHYVTGKFTSEGDAIVISFETPVDAAARMAGLNKLPDKVRLIQEGEMSVPQAAQEQLKDLVTAIPETTLMLLGPIQKSLIEIYQNKDSYTGIPIVPDRLKGSPEERQLQIEHVMENFVTPYFQYQQISRSRQAPPPDVNPQSFEGKVLRMLLEGPLDTERVAGVRKIDLQQEARTRRYDAGKSVRIQRESWLDRLDRAWIDSQTLGNPEIFQKEQHKVRAEGGGIVMADWTSHPTQPRILLGILRTQYANASDPEERARIRKQMASVRSIQEIRSVKSLPKSVRMDYFEDITSIDPFTDINSEDSQ